MKHKKDWVRTEITLARHRWCGIGTEKLAELRGLVRRYRLSVSLGDVLFIDAGWYVTHAGLLRLAHRNRCSGIKTSLEKLYSDPPACRWVFKATVYKLNSLSAASSAMATPIPPTSLPWSMAPRCASPKPAPSTAPSARPTASASVRSRNSAGLPDPTLRPHPISASAPTNGNNGHQNGQPRLRDRLCLLIRQHQLDAGLVKAYAADYCGTPTLRDASRDQVEAFINDLAERATKDRDGLICQLNSYSKSQEVNP